MNMVTGSGPDILLHCSMHKYLSFFWPRYKLIYFDMSIHDVSACAQLHYSHVSVPVPGVTWEGGREQEQEGLV